jgi:tRNA(Arg) A34 adenosine deaminase TadA
MGRHRRLQGVEGRRLPATANGSTLDPASRSPEGCRPAEIPAPSDKDLPMTRDDMIASLRAAHRVALDAATHGHHPFGTVLIGPEGDVLMRQGNIDVMHHAETEIARRAFAAYEPDFLWRCTMVTTVEPCAMCTGALYWANIGRLVYGLEEAKLLALTGNDAKNPTMDLPSRGVLASGQKRVEVHGPFPEIEDELVAPHRDFWRK